MLDLVHYLTFSDWVVALEKGRIAHQGTYDDVSRSGYDLTGTLARSSDTSVDGVAATKGNAKSTADVATKTKSDEVQKETDEDDDETQDTTETRGTTYMFYIREAGYFQVYITALLTILYSAVRLGTQVS